jgi:hypothetical protein
MKNELLAPNGKPSNLTPEQYKLVRTPAFKNWFGDWEKDPANSSKVVDENGEPLVVYHSSNNDFNTFKKDTIGSNFEYSFGFHFSDDVEDSKKYGEKTKSVFLNLRNPKIFNISDNTNGSVFIDNNRYDAIHDIVNSRKDKLKEIDGIIAYGNQNGYVVMYSNQIKLSDGTNTTFDSNSDDIRFDMGGRTISQTPAPKKDRIVGSALNKKSSSKNLSSAKLIKFDKNTLEAIKNKVQKHNQEHPDKKINLASAKAVVRRGMGAYSKSYRPTISGGKPNSRVAWGLARLNAFTYKIVNGKSKSGKYSQDDDLIEELGFKVADYKNGGEMKKDIRCINCGWEWNKKDSEAFDMYVCHKCGFDNTTFYTSIPVNNYSKGGETETKNPDYLKMFLGK